MNKGVYMQFHEDSIPGRKTQVWDVESSDQKTYLGTILWKTGWRRYVFEPAERSVFDRACLDEIAQFIDDLMDKRLVAREARVKFNAK
jgi:hypothetical protein